MDLAHIGLLVLGFLALVGGAELLVRGAARLAAALGLSPLVIGLTVVAFGTSAPELAVGVRAALTGSKADIALGNVVGSNIFNVLAVLGASALAAPLLVSQRVVKLDVPLVIAASVLVLLLALDGSLSRLDGALLLSLGIAYTAFTVVQGRKETREVEDEYEKEYGARPAAPGSLLRNGLFVAAGLGFLVLGADWMVSAASAIARGMGVSELMIGLTIVALGTSLPEAATSLMASLRGERDIAVGNAIGSNMFNLLPVLGLAAIAAPGGIAVADSALRFDLPVMTAVAVACLPIFFTGGRISRWEGVVFLGYYAAYTLYLILSETGRHHLARDLRHAILWFVLPVTVLTIAVTVALELKQRRLRGSAGGTG
jgi:cation:H+ antiporter